MNDLDKRYYQATLNKPDTMKATYDFIKSLNTIEEVRYLWQKHFSPDDDFINHCYGNACWTRIDEIRENMKNYKKE